MTGFSKFNGFIIFLLTITLSNTAQADRRVADVVVYGASPAGVMAAVAAANAGQKVIILEPTERLGGYFAAGLGAPALGDKDAIGGFTKEFFDELADEYRKPEMYRFESSVVSQVFLRMLSIAGVQIFTEQQIKDVKKVSGKIHELITTSDDIYIANVFVDASYEGDLMAKAGVLYYLGRESRQNYGESLAGVIYSTDHQQFDVKIPARDKDQKLLKGIALGIPPEEGIRDSNISPATMKLCLTKDPNNRIEINPPSQYEADDYIILLEYLKRRPQTIITELFDFQPLPNNKFQVSPKGPISFDLLGAGADYPDGNATQRIRVYNQHKDYIQGLLHFLQNDDRVPQLLQKQIKPWGLASDEFAKTDHWPGLLQLRESRRMLATQIMIQSDLTVVRNKKDVIAVGTHYMKNPPVQRVAKDGSIVNEGAFHQSVLPYQISYRCMLPKATQCRNLIIPVCVGVSHVANSSMNNEVVRMLMGHAAGSAAAIASETKRDVHLINVAQLQETLKKQGQILQLETQAPVLVDKIDGVVIDDLDAQVEGLWHASIAEKPFIGKGFLHDNNQSKGQCIARFVPNIPKPGKYRVELAYKANAQSANNVPVAILCADGVKQLKVDQTKSPAQDQLFVPIGVFEFNIGTESVLTISNVGTQGRITVDAVRFVYAGE